LPSGILYAIHDIALPYEIFVDRLYNEQYMLAVYIIGGMMNYKIYFPTGYIGQQTNFLYNLDQELPIYREISWQDTRLKYADKCGGFFELRKDRVISLLAV
jgi:hypothetical protein